MERQGRFRVRVAGALALGAAFSCVGCQGDYPIPASQCDRWCDASQLTFCGTYDPAGCVLTCSQRGGDATECQEALETLITCLRSQPPHELECGVWYYEGKLAEPCSPEEQAYEQCAAPHAQNPENGWR